MWWCELSCDRCVYLFEHDFVRFLVHICFGISNKKMATLAIFVFTLCAFVTVQSYECNFPPSLWCSSREIAVKCQVYWNLFNCYIELFNSLIHKAAGSLVTGRSLQNGKKSMGNCRTERPPDPVLYGGRPSGGFVNWAVRGRHGSLGSAYNEQKDAKENTHCKWVLVVTELFNIAVNDFGAKKSAHYSWVLAVTEVVVRGTQCILKF